MNGRNDRGQFEAKYTLSGEYKELSEEYSEWVTFNTNRDTTSERLKAGVRAWLHWCEQNDVDPYEATERDARRYIKAMRINENAETTITRRVASVSKFYHFLINDPDIVVEIESNPTVDIRLRRDYNISNRSEYVRVLHQEDRHDIIALEYDDIEPIFDHVPGRRAATKARNKLICMMFWQTAVRSDELSRFRVDKIEWDDRQIEIRSSKLNPEDHPDLYHRYVWWRPSLDYQLNRWMSKRSEFDPDDSSPYLFVTENGTQMDSAYMSKIVKQAAHNAGVNEPLVRGDDGEVKQWLYTAHRLRHSRISYLANDPVNMDANALRMMAGHVSFDTTLTYIEPDWDTARNAYVEALEG